MTILKNIPLLRLNQKNLMNRFYNTAAGESIVGQAQKRGVLYGEIHRQGNDISRIVDLEKCSHSITDVHIVDDHVVGTVTVLKTPMGKIVQEFVDMNLQGPGFRPRLECALSYKDGALHVTDIKLITFDLVFYPA